MNIKAPALSMGLKNVCVLTIVDSISVTSMPVNEFVLYRHRNDYPYRQVMIVCSIEKDDKVEIHESIATHYVGSDIGKLRTRLKEIKEECWNNGDSLVCHLHGQKSALLFFQASLGLHLRKHSLYTVHSTYSSRDLKYRLSSCACSMLANYANCVSHAAYSEYALWVKRIKGDRMLAIPNGVDYNRIQEAIAGLPKHIDVADMHKMVCVGRMIPIKNQQFLVKLLKHLPDTELILIGEEDEKIKVLAREVGVDSRVRMTGIIPRDEVFRQLNGCGIYVSASLVEGMPVSVLEAMSVGLIPVLSNIASHKELANICNLPNVLPLEESDWVQSIRACQQLSPNELLYLSSGIITSIKKNFSLENMHKHYNDIYQKLAE